MIERIPRIARAELATRFMRPGVPVILTRQMEGWGALGWTPEVLRQRVGSVVLPVQEGNMEQEPTVLGAACLRDYLDEILRPDGPTALRGRYMAQFELLAACPELGTDLDFGAIFPPGRLLYRFGWIGPAGAVTGLHKDDSHNLLAQLYGRKRVLLFSPRNEPWIYPSRKYDYGARLSYVDAEAPDHARYPLFQNAEREELILAPGEMLFIPRGHWHQVRSLEPSISVSCFAQSYFEYLKTTPESLRWLAHKLRLLGVREGCTCHPQAGARPDRGGR